MEYPWRPTPQSGNFCPVCSNPHFPFCPPLPPQYYRPPPPPPDQLYHSPLPPPPPPPLPPAPAPPLPYDPFVDHQGGPAINSYPPPPHIPPRPWSGNPNCSHNYFGNSNPGSDYDNNGPIGAKRMRINESYAHESLSEDERRLKLIRDHGAMNHGYRPEIQNYRERQFTYQHTENKKNVMQNNGYVNNVHEVNNITTERWEFKNQFSHTHSTQQHTMESKLAHYGLPNHVQPPLPSSPPPPQLTEPPRFRFPDSAVSSSASPFHPSSSYTMVSEPIPSVSTHFTSKAHPNSSGYYPTEIEAVKMASSNSFKGESEKSFMDLSLYKPEPELIDVSHILKHPHRANRPDHIVIILRGLPGSGKSYMAKILRDLEVENGGSAPRIYSMDEYFMTEVEKVVESEKSRSFGSVRGKKPVMKKVMEYCYEPEMEEAYRSSMLKAFKKTLDEGAFPFVIVDDRNLRVADFAQFWATAKRSGYEVYLLEAAYKDPAGCAARNVHGFTQNEIHKMASQWEEAPSLYMKLDIKSLLHGDGLEENGIEEVDMDTEDGSCVGGSSGSEGTNIEKVARPSDGDIACDVPLKDEQKGDDAEERPHEVVKELGKSKWSNDFDEYDVHKTEATRGNSTVLSSLVKSYSKKGKSVRWADQIGRIGFSIGAGKAPNVTLVIGAGSGYNLKSNPLPEEEKVGQRSGESRRRNIFQQQLRAERESFRDVFDKRKQRINFDEE
ncbi:ylp motif-containing protein 1 [Phtheirospermum japonicum]|uniref:Ylp motif-containing protein 1 n=1 Tax=Phtheirospermum japonicum TaxID=374723 RepID=A0A830CYC8_9LAMI|nr:ylp motif-containing protein 1 [Phtheirospermum japonicum]